MAVILYSNHCPQCKILERKLHNKNIDFTEINDIDLMVSKGFMSMPMLEVDGNVMKFKDALNWINKEF